MNIVMVTNTYLPHVGGVARSVELFSREYRKLGHRVLIVCPEFPDARLEPDVVRIAAIQRFNGTDFSVALPIPSSLYPTLQEFAPEVVHSHHPFLLGDSALRIAAEYEIPIVFTHHTRYEDYTHYVPGDSPNLKQFAIELATGYANLCDHVIAPSQSLVDLLSSRGVETPISVIPTGVDLARFAGGNGASFRQVMGIPDDAFVIGHVGRFAPEKNIAFLAEVAAHFIKDKGNAYLLVVGTGPSEGEFTQVFSAHKLSPRLRLAGTRTGRELADAYSAMNVFAFTSKTETQGMVLTEALACGVPVVALDAAGARDVLREGLQEFIVHDENVAAFVPPLERVWQAWQGGEHELAMRARNTAARFSMERTAAQALSLYDSLRGMEYRPREREDSLWWNALRRIEIEWGIWSNVASSAGDALVPRRPWWRLIARRCRGAWQRLQRTLSRSEWTIRLFGLSKEPGRAAEPGLILIQIDGLSRSQLEHALRRKRLRFLRSLLSRQHYYIQSLYSGLPSTTPAVQGELFYGRKGIVPAFQFYLRQEGRTVRMLEQRAAKMVEAQLALAGEALLRGGSSYSNIYAGGAQEAHVCASTLGWDYVLQKANPLSLTVLALSHAESFLRIAGLAVVEVALAVVDCIRGVIQRQDILKELKFIWTRVAVCIALREVVTAAACIDATRGVPVIYLNFLGYDEQAHRRGPSSRLAHWTLKGIDRCIQRIWQAAHRSERREYQVWILSDHGQEGVTPYSVKYGEEIERAVSRVYQRLFSQQSEDDGAHQLRQAGIQLGRADWLKSAQPDAEESRAPLAQLTAGVFVCGMGPVSHVYTPRALSEEEQSSFARSLVEEAHIPAVLVRDTRDSVRAFTRDGMGALPETAERIIGAEHPFAEEVAQDLVALCRHEWAGDLVLLGWNKDDPLSFPLENGAHAGPGPEETHAFVMLPPSVHLPAGATSHLRPLEVRELALQHLGRSRVPHSSRVPRRRGGERNIRLMTYNVHSCVGLDGRLSPERIARVIAAYDPDIVALQELDVRRARSDFVHQAQQIAQALRMDFHFFPALGLEEEEYGDAILSTFPLRLLRAAPLPMLEWHRNLEPRGALWVEVDIGERKLQVINTHLGLHPSERRLQTEALLGPEWIARQTGNEPLVLCGDFNFRPGSEPYKRVTKQLVDVQCALPKYRPRRTWTTKLPIARIDHIFVQHRLQVVGVEVPNTALTRIASDHLPLIVELFVE